MDGAFDSLLGQYDIMAWRGKERGTTPMLWYFLYMGQLALVLFLWAVIAFRDDDRGDNGGPDSAA